MLTISIAQDPPKPPNSHTNHKVHKSPDPKGRHPGLGIRVLAVTTTGLSHGARSVGTVAILGGEDKTQSQSL